MSLVRLLSFHWRNARLSLITGWITVILIDCEWTDQVPALLTDIWFSQISSWSGSLRCTPTVCQQETNKGSYPSKHVSDRTLALCLKLLLLSEAIIKFGLVIYINLIEDGRWLLQTRYYLWLISDIVTLVILARNATSCATNAVPLWYLAVLAW